MSKQDDTETPKNSHDGASPRASAHGGGPIADMDDPRLLDPAQVSENERIVRDGFWPKLRRVIREIPFVDDLLAAYFCAVDPNTPWKVRGILLAALAYFIAPIDVIPDVFAGIGFTDDAAVLLAALKAVADHITPEHRAKAKRALEDEETS